jgi:GNAT superfamily N-acetyltransferase
MQNGEPIFELNDAILERIIFAMEDQTKSRVIDLRTGELVARPEGELELHLAPPPVWTPADGFRLMESFCARIKNLELKRALMRSLSRGKGVFKAFRLVLADYPQEDIQFREYKNALLRHHVESWMDDMRESLGLARMGPEPDEYEELIDEEFALERRGLADSPCDLAALAEESFLEALAWLPAAVATFEKRELLDFLAANSARGFIHFIPDAGGRPIAAAAGAITQSEGRALGILRFLYVAKDFRDLGLEFRLLESVGRAHREQGVETTILSSLFVRPELQAVAGAKGIRALGSQYLVG